MQSAKIQELKYKKNAIVDNLNRGNLELAKEILDSFDEKNEPYFTLYSNYYYLIGDYNAAIKKVVEGLEKLPHSFELTYNLASLKSAYEEYVEAFWLFAKCIRLSYTEENKTESLKQFSELKRFIEESNLTDIEIKEIFGSANKVLTETDERSYPINRYKESLVKKILIDSSSKEYFVEMYKSLYINNVDSNSRYYFKTELINGSKGTEFTFITNGKTVFPLGLFNEYESIEVEGPEESYIFKKEVMTPNQFNYLTFTKPGKYIFKSTKPFFVGMPINLEPKKNSPKLILTIFIDGLSNYVIKNRLSEVMPNTASFFKNGYFNNNCTTTGDWTLPSVASIYTGKSVLEHNLYHPTNHFEINKFNKLFTSDFKKNGYMTAQINNNWRITPTYGYHEDMDRILYQNYSGGFTAGEVAAETIEYLETFKNNNHFLWIGIEDLHDVADEINNDLMSQVHVSAKYRQSRNLGETSVLSGFDTNKIKRYDSELKRIDLHLSTIFNYIEKNYGENEILVAIVSDHGQTYLKKDDYLLHEPKREVPFMLVGKGVKPKVSEEIASIMDIYPTIAKLAGIELDSCEGRVLKDFGGIGREFSITETIHPNQPYLVAITDDQVIFRFKTKDVLSGNGIIDMEEYEANLLDKDSLEDVTTKYQSKFEFYCEYVINRAIKLQK